VTLTFSGQLLLPLAQAIVARTEDAIALMKEQAGAGASTVRLGAVGNVFALVLTPIVASFLEVYPRASLELIEKDDAQLEEAVISGELDCAVMTPWGSTRAAYQHLLTEEILLVVPSEHRLAKEPAGNVIADALRRAGVEPRFSYRANYPELTKALVRRGLGVAPMPKMLVDRETMESLVAVPFQERLYRELIIIYPRDRPLSAAARALIVHVRAGVAGRRESSGRAAPSTS
jgi:DNA-binding transcriptional LysR family regulator